MRRLRIALNLLGKHGGQIRDGLRHVDRVFIADNFTKPATHAGSLVDNCDFEMQIRRARVGLQRNAVKGTDIHAVLARRAIVGDHLGFGNLLQGDAINEIAGRILDAGYRTKNRADSALNTPLRMNLKGDLFTTLNGIRRALLLANATTDTCVCDEISHGRAGNLGSNLTLGYRPRKWFVKFFTSHFLRNSRS
jgi:hypothetical protein